MISSSCCNKIFSGFLICPLCFPVLCKIPRVAGRYLSRGIPWVTGGRYRVLILNLPTKTTALPKTATYVLLGFKYMIPVILQVHLVPL